jgi:hypothetical protein
MNSREIISVGAFGQSQDIGRFAVGKVEHAGGIFGDFGDDEIPQMREKIASNVGQIVTLLGEIVDGLEACVGISIDQRCRERMQNRAISDA